MTAAPQTIFVTGGTGLVGSPRRRGGPQARPPRPRPGAGQQRHDASSTRWASRRSPATSPTPRPCARASSGADWVFNCAAKVGDWGTLEEFRKLNVDALRLLLDAATDAKVARFVHVSSLGVYEGRDHFGTDETTPPAAESLDAYTRSKTEAEALALQYYKDRGLPVAIVRPGFIYGERDRTVAAQAARRRCGTGRFAYFGSGEQALNCIYVKNLVHAIFLAAEVARGGRRGLQRHRRARG